MKTLLKSLSHTKKLSCIQILFFTGFSEFEVGIFYEGNNIHGYDYGCELVKTNSAEECQKLCQETAECKGFSWISPSQKHGYTSELYNIF